MVVCDKNRWSLYFELIVLGLLYMIFFVVYICNFYLIWSFIGGMFFFILFLCENCFIFVKNIFILMIVFGEF